MKCAALIFLVMFTVGKQVVASTPEWNVGTIVLHNNEIRVGQIAVESKHSIVLFKNNDQVEVLPAHRFKSIQYYDVKANVNRKFISLPKENVYREQSQLFEVVLNGKVAVLRKLKSIAGKTVSDVDDFEYYFYANHHLIALRKFRALLYPSLLHEKGNELRHYIKLERLNPNVSADALLIVDHYNRVVAEQICISGR